MVRGNTNAPIGRDEKQGFVQYGATSIDQRQVTVRREVDYITRFDEWLDLQNGVEPRGMVVGGICQYRPDCGNAIDPPVAPPAGDGRGRYIRNMRDSLTMCI